MSGKSTSKLIKAYIAIAMPTLFLAGFFKSPAINYHDSQKVEIDIMRSDEDVAVVLQDLTGAPRLNSDDVYTNKEFTPPIFDEEGTFNSFDLIARSPGQDPFEQPDFHANAITKAYRMFRKLEAKIRRSIELMAAQVLQTGILTLRDKNGTALYTLNFGPKSSHFPNAGTAWDVNGADPLADISALCEVIRTDGLVEVDTAIMGRDAFTWFMKNADVRAQLDNRKMENSGIAPESRGQGATYQGFFWVGNYRVNIWTYNGRYKDPATGVSTPYINKDKVILLSSTSTELDLTFGSIPSIVPPDSRVLPFLPPRLPNSAGGMDLSTYAWVTPDGKQLKVSAGTRPLTIPTGIDTFGAIDTLIG